MIETPQIRLKRLSMRSMRRGIKEMDLILMRYCAVRVPALDAGQLDTYEALLDENDQDLYQWVTGQVAPPARFDPVVCDIKALITEFAE